MEGGSYALMIRHLDLSLSTQVNRLKQLFDLQVALWLALEI